MTLSRRTVARWTEDIAMDPELHLQHRAVSFDFYSIFMNIQILLVFAYSVKLCNLFLFTNREK